MPMGISMWGWWGSKLGTCSWNMASFEIPEVNGGVWPSGKRLRNYGKSMERSIIFHGKNHYFCGNYGKIHHLSWKKNTISTGLCSMSQTVNVYQREICSVWEHLQTRWFLLVATFDDCSKSAFLHWPSYFGEYHNTTYTTYLGCGSMTYIYIYLIRLNWLRGSTGNGEAW